MKTRQFFITLVVATLLTSSYSYSQEQTIRGNGQVIKQQLSVGAYDIVNSAGIFEVQLVPGPEGEIQVSTESNFGDYIEIMNEDKQLTIRVKRGYQLRPSNNHKIVVTVPVEHISGLSLAGSGLIQTQQPLQAEDLKISLAGSGTLQLDLKAKHVDASLAGSGKMIFSGATDTLKLSTAGSGKAQIHKLISKTSEISVAGSGSANVHCTDFLKARVAGSGKITYSGNPNQKDIKVTGSGSIQEAKL